MFLRIAYQSKPYEIYWTFFRLTGKLVFMQMMIDFGGEHFAPSTFEQFQNCVVVEKAILNRTKTHHTKVNFWRLWNWNVVFTDKKKRQPYEMIESQTIQS